MDEVDKLVIGVRADTTGFARDVAAMRGVLEGTLGTGAERAGRAIEGSLLRAVSKGKLGFDELKATALAALDQIAMAALKSGLAALFGKSGSGSGSDSVAGALLGLIGVPGRATGGPVSPGRAYRVGERGPELFVPTASGRIETGAAGGGTRDVRVSITVNAANGEAGGALQRSSRQVARAVKAALAE
jgi:hypothetical protein